MSMIYVGGFLRSLKANNKIVTLESDGNIGLIGQMPDQCNLRQYFDSILSGE